jgi:2-methylcitrate dehydratase PrpD
MSVSPAGTHPTRELAQFVVRTKPEDFPLSVIEKARHCLLDWLGCALIGSRGESARMFLELIQEQGGIKDSTIIGHGKSSPLNAALVNGAFSHEAEFDDVHKTSFSHPGSVVIPAALAIAEREHVSGMAFLASIALGYDVAIRVGEALGHSHYHYWHTTGTCGTFGAAAAAGKVLGLGEREMLHALGNAGTQAAGLWEFLSDGAMTKVLHTGKAAMNGLLSSLLAAKGFTGASRILEGEKGFCKATSTDYDLDKIVDNLAEDYKILKVWLKAYPCCGHTHSAIAAVLDLVSLRGLDCNDIQSLQVRTYSTAIEIAGNLHPMTVREARFSLPFCISAAIKNRKVGVAEFTTGMMEDSDVQELMGRIQLATDPNLNAAYPKVWPVIIKVETKDGRIFEATENYPPGTPEKPMSEEQLISKFKGLASSIVPEIEVENMLNRVANLLSIDDMAAFLPQWK